MLGATREWGNRVNDDTAPHLQWSKSGKGELVINSTQYGNQALVPAVQQALRCPERRMPDEGFLPND